MRRRQDKDPNEPMRVDLLVLDDATAPDAALRPVTTFGGLPAIPPGTAFTWPRCRDACDTPMLYIGKVADPNAPVGRPRLVLLFQCENPETLGGCEAWDPHAGANAAILVPASSTLESVPAPDRGVTVRKSFYGVRIETFEIPERDLSPEYDDEYEDYSDAVQAWREAHPGEPEGRVLGTLGGDPAWLQYPETPTCPSCQADMLLAANLEEGPDFDRGVNFGGGRGYVFTCVCDGTGTTTFLSQQ